MKIWVQIHDIFTFPMQPQDVETKSHDYSSKDTDQGF